MLRSLPFASILSLSAGAEFAASVSQDPYDNGSVSRAFSAFGADDDHSHDNNCAVALLQRSAQSRSRISTMPHGKEHIVGTGRLRAAMQMLKDDHDIRFMPHGDHKMMLVAESDQTAPAAQGRMTSGRIAELNAENLRLRVQAETLREAALEDLATKLASADSEEAAKAALEAAAKAVDVAESQPKTTIQEANEEIVDPIRAKAKARVARSENKIRAEARAVFEQAEYMQEAEALHHERRKMLLVEEKAAPAAESSLNAESGLKSIIDLESDNSKLRAQIEALRQAALREVASKLSGGNADGGTDARSQAQVEADLEAAAMEVDTDTWSESGIDMDPIRARAKAAVKRSEEKIRSKAMTVIEKVEAMAALDQVLKL